MSTCTISWHVTLCHLKKNESMHARKTLFLLVKHHIRVPSECQTVWLEFTVQVRSLLGLIWVQTVATTQTDKDLNVSFCRYSIYFQKIINCTCAYHVYAANRFFRNFHNLWCEEQRLWWNRIHAHATGLCETQKTASRQPSRKYFPKPMILWSHVPVWQDLNCLFCVFMKTFI